MSGLGSAIAERVAMQLLLVIGVAMVFGWVLIEGAIWLWHHLSIGWLP